LRLGCRGTRGRSSTLGIQVRSETGYKTVACAVPTLRSITGFPQAERLGPGSFALNANAFRVLDRHGVQLSPHSSSSGSLSSSSSLVTRTTPSPPFSFNTRPACWSLLLNAFRAPPFVLTSHTCNVPFDPPAAIVSGSSGDHDALKTLPYGDVSERTDRKLSSVLYQDLLILQD
jgi:hypothetical protein